MGNEVLELKTTKSLLDALEGASTKKPTVEELLEQRVSFVFSSMKPDNGVSRDRIKQALVEQDGGKGIRK